MITLDWFVIYWGIAGVAAVVFYLIEWISIGEAGRRNPNGSIPLILPIAFSIFWPVLVFFLPVFLLGAALQWNSDKVRK